MVRVKLQVSVCARVVRPDLYGVGVLPCRNEVHALQPRQSYVIANVLRYMPSTTGFDNLWL